MFIEIVDLPTKNGDVPVRYDKRLPGRLPLAATPSAPDGPANMAGHI